MFRPAMIVGRSGDICVVVLVEDLFGDLSPTIERAVTRFSAGYFTENRKKIMERKNTQENTPTILVVAPNALHSEILRELL